jgi:hypothetical protein
MIFLILAIGALLLIFLSRPKKKETSEVEEVQCGCDHCNCNDFDDSDDLDW